MIPASYIFTETPESAARRATHLHLGAIVLFAVIGMLAILAQAALVSAFVPAFAELAAWQMQVLLAATLALPAYQLHRRFCFDAVAPHLRALPRYLAVQIGVFALAALFAGLAHGVAGMAGMTTVLLVFLVTAAANHHLLATWAFASR